MRHLLLSLLLLLLAACRAAPISPTPVPEILPSATATLAPTPAANATATPQASQTPSPTLTPELPRPQYTLAASLDYDQHLLSVQETITYTHTQQEALPDLLLVVEPLTYTGVFTLETLTWEDGQPVAGIAWEGSRGRIPLPQPLAYGQSVTLHIAYTLNLPNPSTFPPGTRPVPFGYSERQTNLVDWYPYLAPYAAGQGWLAHPPAYYGEHQVYEAADFTVSLQVLSARPGLVVAASAPAEEHGTERRYTLLGARAFAISVSDQYQVFTQEVGGLAVTSYALPLHTAAGQRALAVTVEALELYSELWGAYPFASLSVVEADFLDGMEYSGLYFLSNGFYNLYAGSSADYLTAIAAHETAHQWWYGLVGNDQALEPWLDEALCTYSERIYYEKKAPESLSWWWEARVRYYQPTGWVDTTIYNPEGSPTPYTSYRDAVYLNGALFLEELRTTIGDEAFFAFLKAYAAQSRLQIVTASQFFDLLKTIPSPDLSQLLIKYFRFN